MQVAAQEGEDLAVRLSPVVAHAALGACAEVGETVVALSDLWGRDAARFHEQLRAAASWDDRFAIAQAALARRQEAGRAVDPEVARRLPEGRAVGVDLWSRRDQSGNSREVTLANAAAAGVADRVEVHTADITALPFQDDSFDVVTSALVIHNIPASQARFRAVDEAMRVLRPGGQLLIADPWMMARKYAEHIGQGTLRPLGPGYWYGGPWFGVTLLHAVKET